MSKSRVTGAPPPPRHPIPTYEVYRPFKKGAMDLSILADTVAGVWTHWVTSDVGGVGASLACYQYEGDCPYHDDPLQWTGWLPVYCWDAKKRAVLRLGPREYDVLAAALGIDLKWAGRRVKITPTNGGGGRLIACAPVDEGRYVPLNMGPHAMGRTICLVLHCNHIPRQTPRTEGEEGEGVIPCK